MAPRATKADEDALVGRGARAHASRSLNRQRLESADRRRWARHGSTRRLWDRKGVFAAIHYVVSAQGEPMAVYVEGLDRSLPVAVR
jgi:hypothetical protein